jgi:hypothetical protein
MASSGKISPVIIHHHFDGDMTRTNREFHSKFQSLCVTTLGIKSGTACQTSTSNCYVNTQKFLTENKPLFSTLGRAGAKPWKVVIKWMSIPPRPLLTLITRMSERCSISLHPKKIVMHFSHDFSLSLHFCQSLKSWSSNIHLLYNSVSTTWCKTMWDVVIKMTSDKYERMEKANTIFLSIGNAAP